MSRKELQKPKRPQSAFILFCNDERQRLMKDQPTLKFGDVGKQLGVLWRGINDKMKKKYQDKAAKDKKRYEEEVKEYISKGGDSEDLKRKKKSDGKEKKGSSKKDGGGKKDRDHNEPKRPPSAYLFFSKDEREKLKVEQPTLSFGDIGRLVGERWKEVTSATKLKYQKLADEAKKKYENDLKDYRSKSNSTSSASSSSSTKEKKGPAEDESEDDGDDDEDDDEDDED